MKVLFDHSGNYTIGARKGTHVSDLPKSYVEWASENIKGFKAQYAMAMKPKEQTRPKGRTYILKKFKPGNEL